MRKLTIDLDWKNLLGFDQANPGANPLATSPKIGEKDARGFADTMATPFYAKIGAKDVPGTIGRPQQLRLLLAR